jgi:D-glycero-alpha-D-manno-heptose-7-phosphate kinase
MIISRTPFRVSLFGGGTDLPQWYLRHGGAVIGGAIDKYCYISLRTLPPFFDHKHRIVYSAIELVDRIDDIRHPAVRAVLGEMKVEAGLEIHHDGDLPARSGLGSSSSFTVGLLNALHAYRGQMIGKQELALEAIRLEQQVMCEHVGSQDQMWAAHGGLNRIDFRPDGDIDVSPLILPRARRDALQQRLVLYFTGQARFASDVEKNKIANLDKRHGEMTEMRALVDAASDILTGENGDVDDIGRLLHQGWMLKRSLSTGVSNPAVDEMYQAALDAGALGGKLLGAGGGGFLLLYIPPDKQAAVRERLKGHIAIAFRFETGGSRIVVYEPDDFDRRRQA